MAKKRAVTGAVTSTGRNKKRMHKDTYELAYKVGKSAPNMSAAFSVDKAAGYKSTYQNPGPAAAGAGLMQKKHVQSLQYNMPTAKLIMSNKKAR
jgi:hypothetical protein